MKFELEICKMAIAENDGYSLAIIRVHRTISKFYKYCSTRKACKHSPIAFHFPLQGLF